MLRRIAFVATVGLIASVSSTPARADDAQIARGKYLVGIAGCNDCHTPGYFFGKPDMARFLGGSDVGFEIPGLGVFVGRNITPDKETGIGNWTDDEIITALQTGDAARRARARADHAMARLRQSHKRGRDGNRRLPEEHPTR